MNRVPSGTWKTWRFEFYLSRSRNSLEFVWKVRKPRQNKKFCKKNMNKTWNVKIYNISILYLGNLFQVLYSCNFRMSLVSAFWCQNWEWPFLRSAKKNWEPCMQFPVEIAKSPPTIYKGDILSANLCWCVR